MADLARLDQLGHGAHRVLDRHVGIDAVLVVVPPDVVAETLLALRDAGGEPGDGAQDVPAGYVSTLQPPLLDAVLRLVRSLDDPIEREVLAPLAMRELVLRLLRGEHAAALRQAARGPGQARSPRGWRTCAATATSASASRPWRGAWR